MARAYAIRPYEKLLFPLPSKPMNLIQQLSTDLEQLVTQSAPAVVAIEHKRGQGSGLLLAPDGYILTNAHVVGNERKVKAHLEGGETLEATVVGSDPPTDLAVVQVSRGGLPTLTLASKLPAVGHLVIAMGNPLRLAGSVSLGVVSAVDRSLPTQGSLLEGLLQTDAAINPGNSGGPLVNAWGEVVGINTTIIPWAQGIGFAVPSLTAQWVAALLIQKGEIQRRYLGIGARSEALNPVLAGEVGQNKAVRILEVRQATPASASGLQQGDLLLAIDGEQVSSVNDLQKALVFGGNEVGLEVLRGKERRKLWAKPTLGQAA